MARIICIDYGLKRTGLAVTDPYQIIATGLTTVHSKELISFLKDYFEKDLAGKMSEFTCTLHEVKQKVVPALDEELAKQTGYESVADLKAKAREQLEIDKKSETEKKLRSDLLSKIT